ncbi:polypeptide N-acetylgalactosaminyltransferase 14-like, partial [Otolemur garnettii]|uniref:polypeptide N-acetylgalactosaminyltransferase 14-like n=1 Tax=Otolemur garnettii TaxID=30611 RepID=UPI0002742C4A
VWAFTYTQQILQEELCLSVVTLFPGAPVVLTLCKNGDDRQQWTKSGSHIEHIASHLCLDTDMFGDGTENGKEIVVNPCESSLMSQHWDMMSS